MLFTLMPEVSSCWRFPAMACRKPAVISTFIPTMAKVRITILLDFDLNISYLKEQPGCTLSQESSALIPLTLIKDGIEEASRVLLACNHVRAIKLFTDSINGKCPYVAHRCPSYQHFTAGKCFRCNSGNCALMGYHSALPYTNSQYTNTSENDILSDSFPVAPLPGKYYLTTGKEPLCQRHYRFIIELAKPRIAEHWVQGFLSAGLFSERGKNLRNMDLTPKGTQRFEHGKSYMIVVTNPNDMADKVNKVCDLTCGNKVFFDVLIMITWRSNSIGLTRWMFSSRERCACSGAMIIFMSSLLRLTWCKCRRESKFFETMFETD